MKNVINRIKPSQKESSDFENKITVQLIYSCAGFWETSVDATFMLDILLNFRTCLLRGKKQTLVYRHYDIIMNYLKGFFVMDVLCTIPWDLVFSSQGVGLLQLFKATRVVKLVRILRVLKLIRLLKLLKVCSADAVVRCLLNNMCVILEEASTNFDMHQCVNQPMDPCMPLGRGRAVCIAFVLADVSTCCINPKIVHLYHI